MKHFARLFTQLDATTKTNVRIDALRVYFDSASPSDKIWTIALFSGNRPKKPVNSKQLRQWAAELAQLPLWLFEETYHVVGDLAETMSLIVPEKQTQNDISLSTVMNELVELRTKTDDEKRHYVTKRWSEFNSNERFVFNKLLTGGFRMGVSRKLTVKGLALHTGIDENILSHRLMGNPDPLITTFEKLILSPDGDENLSRPYPFYLAYPLEEQIGLLGNPADWSAEYKWDGIRGQMIVRGGSIYLWTRGEELVTDRYPEFEGLENVLPEGVVIDGEILAFAAGEPLDFAKLQKRIGRKKVGKKLLKEVPVVFMCYDILEYEGRDLRSEPFTMRRKLLEKIVTRCNSSQLLLSPEIPFEDWSELHPLRENARDHKTEGLMIKHKNGMYKTGRKRGEWWKWKADPYTADAVMIYAQRGHGRRANLYSDYTFAVWKGEVLVPFAKAYSGLTDKEMKQVDRFVKQNTVEKFGPVRSVNPEMVFEIAFEGIVESNRHKSGVAVRFPRIKRIRADKTPKEADTLERLKDLIRVKA